MYQQDLYTVPTSLAGLPAVSLPCGFRDGLPMGMQLIAPAFGESCSFSSPLNSRLKPTGICGDRGFSMKWEAVIGLEIHVQLATKAKFFPGQVRHAGILCSGVQHYLGLPGVLPVLNEKAVEMAVRFGLAIGAQINRHSIFDRKKYLRRPS